MSSLETLPPAQPAEPISVDGAAAGKHWLVKAAAPSDPPRPQAPASSAAPRKGVPVPVPVQRVAPERVVVEPRGAAGFPSQVRRSVSGDHGCSVKALRRVSVEGPQRQRSAQLYCGGRWSPQRQQSRPAVPVLHRQMSVAARFTGPQPQRQVSVVVQGSHKQAPNNPRGKLVLSPSPSATLLLPQNGNADARSLSPTVVARPASEVKAVQQRPSSRGPQHRGVLQQPQVAVAVPARVAPGSPGQVAAGYPKIATEPDLRLQVSVAHQSSVLSPGSSLNVPSAIIAEAWPPQAPLQCLPQAAQAVLPAKIASPVGSMALPVHAVLPVPSSAAHLQAATQPRAMSPFSSSSRPLQAAPLVRAASPANSMRGPVQAAPPLAVASPNCSLRATWATSPVGSLAVPLHSPLQARASSPVGSFRSPQFAFRAGQPSPQLHREGISVLAVAAQSSGAAKPPRAFSGAVQHGVGPELWGISLEQLKDIAADPRHSPGMTSRDVVERIIKPDTAGTGAGFALLRNLQQPLRALVMVSHAWDESYDDFVGALERSGEQGPFWVCATALYQPEDMPDLSLERQLGLEAGGPLTVVLAQAAALLCVLAVVPNIFTRLWCLFEMFTAVQLGVEVRMAKRRKGFSWGLTDEVLLNLCEQPINSRAALCGLARDSSADEAAIRGAIQAAPGGYTAVDLAVEEARLTALLRGRERLLGRGWDTTEFGRQYEGVIGIMSARVVELRQSGASDGAQLAAAANDVSVAVHRATSATRGEKRSWAPITRL